MKGICIYLREDIAYYCIKSVLNEAVTLHFPAFQATHTIAQNIVLWSQMLACMPPHLYNRIHPFLPLDHLDLLTSNIALDKQWKEFLEYENSPEIALPTISVFTDKTYSSGMNSTADVSSYPCPLPSVLFSLCSVIPSRSSMRRVAQVMKTADSRKHDKFSNQFNYALNWPA